MQVHLVDGTFELFRAFYGAPSAKAGEREVGAVRSFARSMLRLAQSPDASHVGVAFDTVIESFRNELFDGYKTGEGIDPNLWAQFPLAEQAAHALGLAVFSMHDFEADDGMATAAARFAGVPEVERIVLCSPDKDLAQCVVGDRIVMWDRMRDKWTNEAGVHEKFGVGPASIPDLLALMGDAADGIPGIPRWGAKSTATVLAHYKTIEAIPDDASQWEIKVRGAKTLAQNLSEQRQDAMLYKRLATLRIDADGVSETLDELRWAGVRDDALRSYCDVTGDARLLERALD